MASALVLGLPRPVMAQLVIRLILAQATTIGRQATGSAQGAVHGESERCSAACTVVKRPLIRQARDRSGSNSFPASPPEYQIRRGTWQG